MKALLTGLVALCAATMASAQNYQVPKDIEFHKSQGTSGSQDQPAPECGKKDSTKRGCSCLPAGNSSLRLTVYKQNDLPVNESAASNALPDPEVKIYLNTIKDVLAQHGVGLDLNLAPPLLAPSEVYNKKTTHDPQIEESIGGTGELCRVIDSAFRAGKPEGNRFPLFFFRFGDNLRKEMPETAGQNFSKKAFLDKCGVVGESDSMAPGNFPDYFAVVDTRPEQYISQVPIHEIGHALGHSVAQVPPQVFEDRYPQKYPGTMNIMASQRSVGSPDQMTMSADQVFVLCNSSYVK